MIIVLKVRGFSVISETTREVSEIYPKNKLVKEKAAYCIYELQFARTNDCVKYVTLYARYTFGKFHRPK